MGHSRRREGFRLIYAMCVAEILSMNQYFDDPRFQAKKPTPDGPIESQCGDNIYYRSTEGRWKRLQSRFHNNRECFLSDVGRDGTGRPVFVAKHFFYFGRSPVEIPDHIGGVKQRNQGVRCSDGPLANDFVSWLEETYKPGRSNFPRDFCDKSGEDGPMLTSLDD